MTDFRLTPGFEDVWRPPVRAHRARLTETVLRSGVANLAARARLVRLVSRAPEVMVKISGRTRDPAHLQAHLNYITRKGGLEAEDRDGNILWGGLHIRDLAQDWSAAALADSRRRANTPFSHSIILSMPAGTDPIRLRDAGRAFVGQVFAERFDYVFVLHTDTPRPHVHISVRSLGDRGERLSPKKADLEAWRQIFAEALRERGVAAEATPRRARGVIRKSERSLLRRIRDRQEAGLGSAGRVQRGRLADAARLAVAPAAEPMPWERAVHRRQAHVRRLYLLEARRLQLAGDARDQDLGRQLEAFVRGMGAPEIERRRLARALRAAQPRGPPDDRRRPDRDR